MPAPYEKANIVLGVTGSIACYKAIDLASKLTQQGALVDVIMTKESLRFVSPITFRSITHREVVTELFNLDSELAVNHVAIAERADLIIVAPATANTIAKLSLGLADDVLTVTILASRAPLIIAPAMDANMYGNPVTHENIDRLACRGAIIAGPVEGRLASGLYGNGRLLETPELLGHISATLGKNGDMSSRKIVVTAGGTREQIDPVRSITNRSSGKMGYSIAKAARDRGADTILITAPTCLPDPVGIKVIHVETAMQMHDSVIEACLTSQVLIMAAAVADWRPLNRETKKVKKGNSNTWRIDLVKNPDILDAAAGNGLIKVGFAAESEDLIKGAEEKLSRKNLHLIVANDITESHSGFNVDTNRVTILSRDGKKEELPLLSKYEVGHRLLDHVVKLLQ